MFLRRLTANLRAQNWTAIAIEFLIVVLGVFIGTQVSNWNQERLATVETRRMLAQLVARNLAVETLTDPAPTPVGQSAGEAVTGGRRLRWTRITSRTPDQRLVRVDISVASSGAPTLLTIVRPAT